MAIWGVGVKFGGWDNKLASFITENFWCTGFSEEEKPDVYETLKEIKIGDIIYAKSMFKTADTMNVRAVGIVTDTFKNSNSHIGFENCSNEIGVKWLIGNPKDAEKVLIQIKVDDQYINERKTTIFKERNLDIIQKVVALLKSKDSLSLL